MSSSTKLHRITINCVYTYDTKNRRDAEWSDSESEDFDVLIDAGGKFLKMIWAEIIAGVGYPEPNKENVEKNGKTGYSLEVKENFHLLPCSMLPSRCALPYVIDLSETFA